MTLPTVALATATAAAAAAAAAAIFQLWLVLEIGLSCHSILQWSFSRSLCLSVCLLP